MGLLEIVLRFYAGLLDWLKPDLPPLFSKMTPIDRILFLVIHTVDKHYPWHRLPVFLGLAYLEIRRTLHQRYSLINVGQAPISIRFNPEEIPYRTANGELNDPFNSDAGEQGSFFGRNVEPSPSYDNKKTKDLLEPHPTLVATKLLARKKLVDNGIQFNMLAASWIQFMIHDWIDHEEDMDASEVEIVAPSSVSSACPLQSYKFHPTKKFSTNNYDIPIGHKNIRTPWWDGSAIYGSNAKILAKVRTFKDGKLHIGDKGLLPTSKDGLPLAGDIRNSWVGVSLFQALFIREHNAVCDKIKSSHPKLSDEQLYRHARLVVSAVIAKVHTIDWTVELLKMDTLYVGLRSNWYGVLEKKFKDLVGHTGSQVLSGFVGMRKPRNHDVPYSLTEDFVAVYRMHSLLPDSITLRDISSKASKQETKVPPIEKEILISDLLHDEGEKIFADVGFEPMLVSMGHQSSGALTLWNYPTWMRELVPQDPDGTERTHLVDLPSLEIYRDRERHVPRYNEFRRRLLMVPIKSWKDLTDDADAIGALHEVYGNNVEQLDLLVGLMAEKKIKGYAISETAFHIFLLMASRRLEADRFFTSDFNEDVYTKEGLEWVNTTESLKDVLVRHHKHALDHWLNPNISAFSVWSADPPAKNHIPILLRIP
ncbi:hypothetical protein L7F22_054336 [Adiantum nelumboides]|nr:hypothetical protein [Adiantum nelumboides]